MSKDIESDLRAALRPLAPSDEFTQKLVSQMVAQPRPQPAPHRAAWALSRRSTWWLSAGLAASVILAVGVHNQLQQERERENGLEARREVVEALRMTSQKLNLAYETVQGRSTSQKPETPGV
jgi:anti-sigma factor RsiW